MTRRPRRRGFTLIELLAVLAVVLILAALVLPSLSGMKGNASQKYGADTVRAMIADARSLAMTTGETYRLAVKTDGTVIRFGPDAVDFAQQAADTTPGPTVKALEQKFESVTVSVASGDPTTPAPGPDSSGWVTVATFLPDGTCIEDRVVIEVHEESFPVLKVSLRGVTGASKVLPQEKGGAH